MKNLWAISLLFLSLSSCAQLNPQSKKVTEKFFPEFDVTIDTPAFQKKKGFTTHDEMMAFLRQLETNHAETVLLTTIGKSQKGKDIPMVTLSKNNGNTNKVRVFCQGGLHGNEPASTESMLYLLDQLLNNPELNQLLDRIDLRMIPMANIDGYEKQDRYAANGLDLNRDQTKLMAQESVYLKKAFSDYNAEVALDFHEYRPYRKDFTQIGTFGITSIYDVMFLYSGNLNVPENLRAFTEEPFISNVRSVMDEKGLRHHDYISSSDHDGHIHFNQGSSNARSSATSYALTNSISALIEVRGVGINRTSFKRRVMTGFYVAESFLRTTYNNVDEIKKQIQIAKEQKDIAVVKSKPLVSEQQIQTIDLDKVEEITLDVTIRDALNSSPVLTRERPNGYVIRKGHGDLIEKLRTLGLDVTQISEPQSLEVEKYIVKDYYEQPEKYEGATLQKITTDVVRETIEVEAGTWILVLNQPKGNIAIEVLEPEAPNSFVSFGILKTEAGAELPTYRLIGTFLPEKP